MGAQSKLTNYRMYLGLVWSIAKDKYAYNPTTYLMAGFVGMCIVTLARGMNRDRQSSTAAKTEQLLQLQKDDKQRKRATGSLSQRLSKIVKIIIPGWKSKESIFVCQLSGLLIARTIFSIVLSELIGENVMHLVSRNWFGALWGCITFVLLSFPASFINTFIKHITKSLALRFRVRLSQHVNRHYIKGVNFYAACNLKGIEGVDQRVTSDVKLFCEEIASIYSSMFKPVLDIVLFTNQLRLVTGWQGPTLMYSYFFLSAVLKRVINRRAKFGKLVAGESAREGEYRTAHQRLITNSEEVAFYDGAERELNLVNQALHELFYYSRNHNYVRSAVDVCDQLLLKYWATLAGYIVMWIPILTKSGSSSAEMLSRDYARVSRYLSNVSQAVGDLVLVINSFATLSGRIVRVSELLETVEQLDKAPIAPFIKRAGDSAKKRYNPHLEGIDEWMVAWKTRCDAERNYRVSRSRSEEQKTRVLPGGGVYIEGDIIQFEDVDIVSPEGTVLVKDLNFIVHQGENVMITGPNGAGKSSLFRVIGELWPLSCGTVTKPMKEDILFVPQKPYLVKGSLREQIIYPHSAKQMQERGVTDEDLSRLLALVDPANDILSTWSFDDQKDWFRAFSGGQKQRVAMARVFYHRPLYAILDECTSAVSSEVENAIYETGNRMGITLFTVSHRESLKVHHDHVLYVEGIDGRWKMIDVSSTRRKPSLSNATPNDDLEEAEEDTE